MSVSSSALALAGTPLMSLNEDITVIAPASKAALNGGRCTSRRVCGEMSTMLYSMPAITAP
ncbi:hypothetical protein D3C72_1778960 [compost metagenome]